MFNSDLNSNLGCDLVKASLYATGASKRLELIFLTNRKYNSVSFNCANLNSGNGISIFGSNDNVSYTNIVQNDSTNGDRTFTGLSSYKYIKIQNRYDGSDFSTDINNIKWS